MEPKAHVSYVFALLLLQFAGLSLASETSLQNIANQGEGDNVSAPSPPTDVSVSKTTLAELQLTTTVSDTQLSTKRSKEKSVENGLSLSTTDHDGAISSALDEREERLFALYTTKNKALFVTTTKTALSTCFSANSVACTGRKRRKRAADGSQLFMQQNTRDPLDASLNGDTNSDPAQELVEAVDRRSGKGGGVTIWTTLFNTFTITTTYYIPGTTVSISGMCGLPGLDSSCFG